METSEIEGVVTTEVRETHRFDVAALERYMREHVEGFRGPVTVRQFHGGQSCPTYYLESPGGKYVLRRKPPGKLLPSAHAVDREYRVITALGRHRRPGAADLCALRGPGRHRHRVLHHGVRARPAHGRARTCPAWLRPSAPRSSTR